MVLKNKKKQKSLQNSNVGVGEDKISNLPDALIHHILSFLPTKCGMSTCILSKRWKYVVYSIPTLNFSNWRTLADTRKERKLETKLFMNFIDTVLFIHEKPDILKLYLGWNEFVDESRVNRWITTIMKRKVEEICLYIECPSTSSILPLSFFTCDSLNLLDLRFGIRTVTKFIIPNTVYFPKLKILRLECLSFVDGTSPNKLFSNCPILEELSLRFCAGFQNEVLWIANPTLKQLYIGYCCFGESAVKICAPNLSTMILRQMRPDDFVVDSFSSLVEADINLLYVSKFPIKLFKKLSNVKLLKMSGVCFPVQSEADILLTDLPAFNNLIHLEVRSRYYCTGLASDSISVMRRFFRFLQLSPNLESIVFAQSIHILGDEDDGCWSLDPKYSLPHLKSIKVKYFNGEPTELNAIKLFLKYLSFLETVTIVASPGLSKDHAEQINAMKLLLMFPKPAKCVVKFLTSSEKA